MDPLSAACAAAQFIGLAGQAVQGISWLRRKFKDIKSAPRLIRSIFIELGVLERTLAQLSSLKPDQIGDDAARNFEATLTSCIDIFDSLGTLLIKYDSVVGHAEGPKKLWKQLLVDDKRLEIEEYLRRLERAKSSLLATMAGIQIQITNDFRQESASHARYVERSLDRVESGISSVYSISQRTYNNTEDTKIKVEEIADIVKRVDRSVQDLRTEMPTLIRQDVQCCLQEQLLECLKSLDLPCSKQGMINNNIAAPSVGKDRPTAKSVDSKPVTSTAPAPEAPWTLSQEINVCDPSISKKGHLPQHIFRQQLSRTTSVRVKSCSRSFALPIGFIQTRTTQRTLCDTSHTGKASETEVFRIEISFVPFRWLSSRGQIVSIKKVWDQHNNPSWTFTPRMYNFVSNDSMILQACEKRDISAVKMLFEYRQASPFDVASNGASLMSFAFGSASIDDDIEGRIPMIQFLISQGADPTPFISEFLVAYKHFAVEYGMLNGADFADDDDPTARALDQIWRLCLQHCHDDPFVNLAVLEKLWDASLGGYSVPPLDAAYLFHEEYTGFDNLVFENPDKVFSDLVSNRNWMGSGSDTWWTRLIDQQYETLVYLCMGGKDSIKAKVFSESSSAMATRQEDSCFCASNTVSNHLLMKLLNDTNLFQYEDSRIKTARRHIRRVLVLLLQNGEDPEGTCSCKTRWQCPNGYRSATDIAANSGLLRVWLSALEECGFESVRIFDEWRLEGVPQLFDEVEESSMVTTSLMSAGRAIYTALSVIV